MLGEFRVCVWQHRTGRPEFPLRGHEGLGPALYQKVTFRSGYQVS